jgi:hypothetical protein
MEPTGVMLTSKGTTIRGTEKVPTKLIELIAEGTIAEYDRAPVWTVVFKDDEPCQLSAKGVIETIYSTFSPANRVITINLGHHFKRMVAQVSGNGVKQCRMRGMVWLWWQLLMSFHHELYHAFEYNRLKPHERYNFHGDCDEADKFALKKCCELAKTQNIEPPKIFESDCELWATLRAWEDSLLEEDTPWANFQYDLVASNKAYKTEVLTVMDSLKEYLRLVSGSHLDPSWEVKFEERPKPKEAPKPIDTPASMKPPTEEMMPPDIINSMVENIHTDENTEYTSMFEDRTWVENKNDYMELPVVATNPSCPPNPTEEAIIKCAVLVFGRLHAHIYDKCGFEAGIFKNPGAVLEPISIADIPYAKQLFSAMETVDALGREIKSAPIWPTGQIKGRIMGNSNLPSYKLFLKGGLERNLIPQNSAKTQQGTLTAGAKMALAGKEISYVYKSKEHISISFQANPKSMPTITIEPFDKTGKKRTYNL